MTRENSNVKPSDIRRSEVRKTNRERDELMKNSTSSQSINTLSRPLTPHRAIIAHSSFKTERNNFWNLITFSVLPVKMMVKAYRTEEHARESFKDLILDDHTQCGCECGEESGGQIGMECKEGKSDLILILNLEFQRK